MRPSHEALAPLEMEASLSGTGPSPWRAVTWLPTAPQPATTEAHMSQWVSRDAFTPGHKHRFTHWPFRPKQVDTRALTQKHTHLLLFSHSVVSDSL